MDRDDWHWMIDCETWGTADDAVIRAVALAPFDPMGQEPPEPVVIDARNSVDSQLELGRSVDAETVAWWRDQRLLRFGEGSRWCAAHTAGDIAMSILKHMQSAEGFYREGARPRVWSRGNIDCRWLRSLFAATGYPVPWKYWQERDVRTLDEIVPPTKSTTPHHPGADVPAQIDHVRRAFARVMAEPRT